MAHLVQAPSPVAALYVATGQAVQDVLVPSGTVYPAEQTQSVTAVEAVVVVDLPVGQLHKDTKADESKEEEEKHITSSSCRRRRVRIAKEGRDSLAVLDSHLGHAVAIPVLGWYVPAKHLQGHTLVP